MGAEKTNHWKTIEYKDGPGPAGGAHRSSGAATPGHFAAFAAARAARGAGAPALDYPGLIESWLALGGGGGRGGRGAVRPLATGLSGAAFEVPAALGNALLDGVAIATASQSTYVYAWSRRPPPGAPLVVKLVAVHNPKYSTPNIFKDYVREVGALKAFNEASPVRAGRHAFDIRTVTPRLYRAGFVREHDVLVIVEDAVPGQSVSAHLKARRPVPPALLAKMERAVLTLWLAGYVHSDLHKNNMMITPGGNVAIIDFGRPVPIPRALTAALAAALAGGAGFPEVLAFWETRLRPLAQAATHARRIASFTNVALIGELGERQDPGAMAAARAAEWMTTTAKEPPPLPPQKAHTNAAAAAAVHHAHTAPAAPTHAVHHTKPPPTHHNKPPPPPHHHNVHAPATPAPHGGRHAHLADLYGRAAAAYA